METLSSAPIEPQVLAIVQEFVASLGNERALRAVSLHAALDKDLGLGSLERVELFLRLQQNFGVQLPQDLSFSAQTVQDFVNALRHAPLMPSAQLPSQRIITPTPTAAIPTTAKTLTEVLRSYAELEPKRPHIYLQLESGEEQLITYGQLLEASTAIATGLLEHGLVAGARVALMLPTSKEFFYAFFGILLAGGIPVPTYPPFRLDKLEDYAKRAAILLNNAQVQMLITGYRIERLVHLLRPFVPSLQRVLAVAELMTQPSRQVNIPTSPDLTALIQYTSGSTGNPKGVQLTHGNILANIRAFGQALAVTSADITVSWLPLYHDMGLIGSWLGSLYFGIPAIILSPLTFLAQPQRWLWAIHTHRATVSAAPNFAYELCARKIPEEALQGLDLSSWRVALNGAEAVNPATLKRFTTRFAKYGFPEQTLLPVYGLAESTVGLTIPPLNRAARIDNIARKEFTTLHQAIPTTAADSSTLQLVACGKPLPGHEVRIVDENDNPLPERVEGSVQFRGPSTMQGYFNAPEITQAIRRPEGWWDSGDAGYLADGEVFITGRKKDLIIKGGRNFYPQELEEIASEVAGIRKGCVVAFGIEDPATGTEKIIVIAETRESNATAKERMLEEITANILAAVGVPPDNVHLVAPGIIAKTSSGKLRRASCKQAYLQKKLVRQRRLAPWLQVTRLWFSGLLPRLQNLGQSMGCWLYGGYAYSIVLLTVLPVWLLILPLPPRHPWIGKLIRGWARTFLWLIGSKPQVTGRQHLSTTQAMLFIANHASYLDAIVLLAVLPVNFTFVAKRELLTAPIIGGFIKKQHYITVDRTDFAKGLLETAGITQMLKQGRSVQIFPEATFTHVRGVRPFKLGAFKVAVETGTALYPIAIQGTRQILASDSPLPRHGSIHVTILEPLVPTSKEWDELIRLRDVSRAEIAKHCGEPLLNLLTAGWQATETDKDNKQ